MLFAVECVDGGGRPRLRPSSQSPATLGRGSSRRAGTSDQPINVVQTREPDPPQPRASIETPTTFIPVNPVSNALAPTSSLRTEGAIAQAVVRIELRSG